MKKLTFIVASLATVYLTCAQATTYYIDNSKINKEVMFTVGGFAGQLSACQLTPMPIQRLPNHAVSFTFWALTGLNGTTMKIGRIPINREEKSLAASDTEAPFKFSITKKGTDIYITPYSTSTNYTCQN